MNLVIKEKCFISENQIKYQENQIIFPKKTFIETNKIINSQYFYENEYFSNAFDILSSYLKGQKIIHMEAADYSEKILRFLIIPSIVLSTLSSILSSYVTNITNGQLILSFINGLTSIILTIIAYLKMDAKAESFKISANQYEKLQSMCEFYSGTILLFKKNESLKKEDINNKLLEIQTKIKEINETNKFIIPNIIRLHFPTTFNINIFSIIKRIENFQKEQITLYKNTLNYISYLKQLKQINHKLCENEKTKLKSLYQEKNNILQNILRFKSSFSIIDEIFKIELENNNKRKKCCYYFNQKILKPEEQNDFIKDILNPFITKTKYKKKVNYFNQKTIYGV
ncbi:hypothetical protein OAI84_00300 [bacterium]|nr:hypothetical protein [bacterium]